MFCTYCCSVLTEFLQKRCILWFVLFNITLHTLNCRVFEGEKCEIAFIMWKLAAVKAALA